MLAEIFLLRIESILRASGSGQKTTSSDARFVPIAPVKTTASAKPADRRS